ncbi:hypothetical protein P170DRAFT_63814 [Aspergillus steynii IBT 23096]|uniref:Transposase MuDR plant domain-containing protein n=1 Tax=Aspergillus steynii IBT 23096 TaxID=1392250 RepID=A0A2I2FTC2_9EURO|nr:uncharacterized protein P170DRAFT_63814 [Aspergillus steynii IBT 23096]PLB43872.1 hypothetical protein P170DRAFT_63814 [Aspergillus steynii IBT 23096]
MLVTASSRLFISEVEFGFLRDCLRPVCGLHFVSFSIALVVFVRSAITMTTAADDTWQVGMQFPSMKEARDALVRHTLDLNTSFRVEKANSEKYFTACRSGSDCPYKVRMYMSRKTGLVRIQTYEPLHSCPAETHDNWRPPVPTSPDAEGSPPQPKSPEQVRNGSIDIFP